MPEGLPIPGDTVRQTWGQGVRAGMYPISDTELYWFTVFNAPEVGVGCFSIQHQSYSTCCISGCRLSPLPDMQCDTQLGMLPANSADI